MLKNKYPIPRLNYGVYMKKTLTGVLLVFLFSAVFAGTQALIAPATETTSDLSDVANFAIYADFPEIDGESEDKEHMDWVEILSFEFSMHKPTSMTGSSRRHRARGYNPHEVCGQGNARIDGEDSLRRSALHSRD